MFINGLTGANVLTMVPFTSGLSRAGGGDGDQSGCGGTEFRGGDDLRRRDRVRAAAVGLLAGVGAWDFAVALTGMVVFVNLGLRPLVKWMKRNTKAGVPLTRAYRVVLTCLPNEEAAMRAQLLRMLTLGGLHISEISGQTAEGTVALAVTVSGEGISDQILEQAVQRMAAEPGLMRLSWEPMDDG